jgi:tetratricopeptide (TPR) repeat protein
MNTVIRDVARRHGATVVDVLDAFAAGSRGGAIGNELILEHLHPNIDGQFLIADVFYEALRAAGEIGEWTRAIERVEARSRAPVTAVDSIAGEYRVQRLTARYPFVPQGTSNAAVLPTPADDAGRIARSHLEDGLPWVQAQGRLQELYARQGRWLEAAHVNRVVGQEMIHTPIPLLYAAEMELWAGRPDRALRDVVAAEARHRTSRGARIHGQISFAEGDTAGARAHFQEALARDRGDRTAVMALRALDDLPTLRAALLSGSRPSPTGSADAHFALGTAYYLLGSYDAARVQAERALRLSPDHRGAGTLLRRVDPERSP